MGKSSTFYRDFIGLILLALTAVGCAGPASPFGAVEVKDARETRSIYKKSVLQSVLNIWQTPEVQVTTIPAQQIFHRAQNVQLKIKDNRGFTDESKVYVFYNGRDVTKHFKKMASDPTELVLQYPRLRLNPRRLHEINIAYQREPNAPFVTQDLNSPVCALEEKHRLKSIGEFSASDEVIEKIKSVSDELNLNPGLLAAVVAQESGFNPRAVSVTKAIGLTQMTHIAEEDILDQLSEWPRYPGIRRYSYLQLKYKIATGAINANQEWRLRPDLSLQGGAMFLNHLREYWARPQKKELLERTKADPNQVLLASYNIGASAVSGALERKGKDWLVDKTGAQALKYVQMVGSYCQDFTTQDKYEL